MTSAPRSEWRCRQDDAHFARRWAVRAASQARGRINFEAFRYFGPIPKNSVIGRALPLWTDEESDGRYQWRAPTR